MLNDFSPVTAAIGSPSGLLWSVVVNLGKKLPALCPSTRSCRAEGRFQQDARLSHNQAIVQPEDRRKSNVTQRCALFPQNVLRCLITLQATVHGACSLACLHNGVSIRETLHNVSGPPCQGAARNAGSFFVVQESVFILRFSSSLDLTPAQSCIHSTAHLHFLRSVIGS
jgi:hypothetical protein